MENIFLKNDIELIESFQKQILTKEDCISIAHKSDAEFSKKEQEIQRSTWYDDEVDSEEDEFNDFEEEVIDRYNIKLPDGYEEIELYDNYKTFDENFAIGKSRKYILVEVNKDKSLSFSSQTNGTTVLPTLQSKIVIDMEKLENSYDLEYIPIDYDTLFGLRLLSFIKYKSDFFTCEERVMFEAFIIKFQRFGFQPFFWSKETIFKEVGIKKDRATTIIKKFIDLGIASKEVIKKVIDSKPRQISHYNLNPHKIIELIPDIYVEREKLLLENEIKKYLFPVLKKK